MANDGSGFEVPISFPLDPKGAIHADDLLKAMRQQIKGVSDETKAYNDWLARNAKELGAVSKAQEAAAAELERYYATLEKMHQAQVQQNTVSKEAVKLTQSLDAGAADLSKTQSDLEKNTVTATKATDSLIGSKHEWLKIAKMLPPELVAIGAGLKLIFSSPLVATAMALLFALSKIRDVISEARQKLDGLKLNDLRADVGEMADAAIAAATNWDSWSEAISKTSTSVDDATNKLRTLAAAQEAVSNAAYDEARAKVESDPKLSPEMKAIRLGQISAQRDASNTSRAQALRKAEIGVKQRELETAEALSAGGLANRKPLSNAAEAAAGASNANQDRIDNAKAAIAALEDKNNRVGLNSNEFDTLRSYRKVLAAAEAAQPELEGRVKSTGAALTSYDSRIGAARSSIPTLRSEISGLGEADKIQTDAESLVSGSQNRARRTRDLASLDDPLANRIPGAFAYATGKSQNQGDVKDFNELKKLLRDSRTQTRELIKLLTEIYKDGVVTPEEMNKLRRLVTTNNQRP